jgi:acylphosphatase
MIMEHSNPGAISRARVVISGRVQGVSFRANTRDQARSIGIRGWVRNLSDGRVEAIFEGPQADVQRMIHWCNRGPAPARVANVEVHWEPPTGQEPGFRIVW